MGLPFTIYARKFLVDPAGAQRAMDAPVLVWEAPPSVAAHDEALSATQAASAMERPRAGEPLVFELKKTPSKLNAFALGITVGRTDNNDVVLVDASISRFHAYLQRDAKGWRIVDAESLNGTWVGGVKLVANQPQPLGERARLKIGNIELLFLSPAAFVEYVKSKLK